MRGSVRRAFVAAAVAGVVPILATAAAGPRLDPVSVTPDGSAFVNGACYEASISNNGRFVAFHTAATDAVADDGNGRSDVFVRDRRAGVTESVSVASDGSQGDGNSYYGLLSGNGRWVLFNSDAGNLVAGDDNGSRDLFLHDRMTGETRRVSVAADGTQADAPCYVYGASLSGSGRFATFNSSATTLTDAGSAGHSQVFVVDLQTGEVTLVSADPDGLPGDAGSYDPSFSSNGRFVAFYSAASNLVADSSNEMYQVYVYDLRKRVMRRASVSSDGTLGDGGSYDPVVSNNGQVVAFYSEATNLIAADTNARTDTFVHDFRTGETRRISQMEDGTEVVAEGYEPAITASGRTVLFYTGPGAGYVPEDTNGEGDTYSFDLKTGALRLVSVNDDGAVGDRRYSWLWAASMTPTGRWLALTSDASNFSSLPSPSGGDYRYQVFVLDPR